MTKAPNSRQDDSRWSGRQLDPDLDQTFVALSIGDPTPVVTTFAALEAQRATILRRLLESDLDYPVSAVFSQIWQDIGPQMTDDQMNLLRWYLGTESTTRHPDRKAALRATLARVIALPTLPQTDAGSDLGFAAVRLASEGPMEVQAAGSRFLRRLANILIDPTDTDVRGPMLFAALHIVDLTVLKILLDRLPATLLPQDLQHGEDWATGLMIEFAGIDPWLSMMIERRFRRDPQSPVAAQRKTQLEQHRGKPFSSLATLFHDIRFDSADHYLKPALQFAYWRAQNDNLPDEIAFLSGHLRALDAGWTDNTGPTLTSAPGAPKALPQGSDLAGLTTHALDLASLDLDLASPSTPEVLRAGFDDLTRSTATAPFPPSWTLSDLLQAAQSLVQIDRREYSWIVHFVDAPHAHGLPQYGTIDLARFPVIHAGLMASIAALCRAGLDWLMAGHGTGSSVQVARLAQLHTRASLEIDQPEVAVAFLKRIEDIGILTDVVAILRDNCQLQVGMVGACSASPPPSRLGSDVHPFLDQPDWTAAEDVAWSTLAEDAGVAGQFEIVWPDGTLAAVDHTTPAGHISTACIPGLALIAEDFLLGPAGHVLRPNTYHTSAEFPWESAVVVAAQKRALRLRPTSASFSSQPVLLLEAFETLRWRNYYHWMVPILSRVALAQQRGLLDDRLLVVPEGLSRWMTETLDLIGLPPDRQLVVPLGQKVRFRDALLMSSIEHVSKAALQALRHRLLGPAPGETPSGHYLFLSRRSQKSRKLHNEADLEDMAHSMGFHVISPQDYSISDQITLFSRARGIAAAEGAALTNTMFCPPGARVLAVLCLNDMMPIFNDLSLVLGHHHRKLAGRGLTGVATGNRFQPQFDVDLDLARQSLAWVLEG